ncbi:MAG: Uma2 family endonuclease [Pirellulales bacterium]
MATVSSVPADSPSMLTVTPRLLTAADVAAMPEQLPTGPVSYELHHGRLVPMSPPGADHGSYQLRIGSALMYQGEAKGLGKAYVEVGVILARNPDHVFGPDAAFVAKRSLPSTKSPEGFLEKVPELVVEVRSKNDTAREIAVKVSDYLQAGATLVWVADPSNYSVIEHRSGKPPKTYLMSDMLTCDDVIPGFRLPLAELYQQ